MNQVYKIITDTIIKRLEQGEIPWVQPWTGDEPQNLISRKPYRGINQFLLSIPTYQSPFWLTYKQAQRLGGSVKKGEKSTPVIFYKNVETGELDDNGDPKIIRVLRYYRVFNIDQCELPENRIPKLQEKTFEPLQQCEKVIANMPKRPPIEIGTKAAYNPTTDKITIPRKGLFASIEDYYSTLFREMGHSTGHKSRLNRKEVQDVILFGSHDYSKEELVAEMTSAYLCGYCKIERTVIENAAAYIQGWLKKFRDKPKMLIQAASKAQKATDFILGNDS